MPTQSPRAVAGFAMLALGFFDGILGVTWLVAHLSLNASLESLGWVLGAVGFGSAIGSAFAPTLLKRVSHLRALYMALAVQTACMVLIGLSTSLWVFVVWYGVRGLANGVAHASLNAYFAPRISSRHLMNIHGGWGIGTASAGLLSGLLLGAGLAWYWIYLIGALLTAGALSLVWMSLKHFAGWSTPDQAVVVSAGRLTWPVWILILSGGLYVGLEQGVGNWLSALLVETAEAEVSTAGVATAIFWGALTGGRFLLTRVRGSEETILLRAAVVILLSVCAAPWLSLVGQMVCYGLSGLAMAPLAPFIITVVARQVPAAKRDQVMALQILVFSAGAALIPAAYGVLATQFSITVIAGGIAATAALLLGLFWITVGTRLKGVS